MSRADRPSFEFGPFRLDVAEQLLLRNGQAVPLTPKIFDVLRVLVENAGHLVEKEQLLTAVWPDSFVEEGALNRSVSVLRKALSETPEQKYIETVPKRGYRFVATVSASHDRPAPPSRWSRRVAGLIGALLTAAAFLYAVLGRSEGQRPATPSGPTHRQITFTGTASAPTLSPDGTRIAYVTNEKPEKKLIVQQLPDGPPHTIFSGPEVSYVRWSPDGTELIMWTRGAGKNGIYVISQFGGTPRPIKKGLFNACWSPDGSTIAVASYGVGKIWLVDKSGQPERTISVEGTHWSMWDIDWSPATDLMVFVSSDYEGQFTIWTVRPDGSELRKILTENTEIPAARWTPAGDAIYYLRRASETMSLFKVFVRPGDDAHVATVMAGVEIDRSFALSGDGKRLVYGRAPFYSNLWVREADGRTKQLTHGTSLIERPRISPDGTSILFNIGREPLTNLYTMPIAGGIVKQVTFLDSSNIGGAWSADGTRIAFVSTQGGTPHVWTAGASGEAPKLLSRTAVSDSFHLTWFPGPHVLFQQGGNRNFYDLNPDTGEEQLLAVDPSVGWMFSPVYSPDGRRIAVQWNRKPKRGIWIIDRHNRRERLVEATAGMRALPIGWSDGGALYSIDGEPGAFRGAQTPLSGTMTDVQIFKVSLDGGPVETLATLAPQEVGSVTMTRDARTFIYTAYSASSDVWVVDDFEPAVTTRRR